MNITLCTTGHLGRRYESSFGSTILTSENQDRPASHFIALLKLFLLDIQLGQRMSMLRRDLCAAQQSLDYGGIIFKSSSPKARERM